MRSTQTSRGRSGATTRGAAVDHQRPAGAPPDAAEAPAASRRDLRTLLVDGRFRTLAVAHVTSDVGDWLAFMALFSISTFEWNVDVLGISVLGVAYMLPFAVVAPWAGVWVDRWDLRRVLVVGDLGRAALVLAMAFSTRFAPLAALLFLHQAVACFFNPAQHAAIPRLVRREHLLAANALNSQASQVTKILGPGVAGILVAALGARGCFFVDAATFAVSALLLATLPGMRPAQRTAAATGSFRDDFRSGAALLWRRRRLRAAVFMLACGLWGLGAFIAILPVWARDQLHAGARLMGLLVSGLGVGAVAGALGIVRSGNGRDRLLLIGTGTSLAAIAIAAVGLAASVVWGLVATAFLGGATAVLIVPAHALFQEEVPAGALARVLSLAFAALAVSQALGMAVAGIVSRAIAPNAMFLCVAGLLFASGVAMLLWGRSLLCAAAAPGARVSLPPGPGARRR